LQLFPLFLLMFHRLALILTDFNYEIIDRFLRFYLMRHSRRHLLHGVRHRSPEETISVHTNTARAW
jgi:hypothetical protein